ncbi:hypothetical protein T484DRAFT_2834885 [Baffinella frigidus]|nr:hypothetical protein T484DRAFT_2834885 [Cryptophyta sp. CCMP2293]
MVGFGRNARFLVSAWFLRHCTSNAFSTALQIPRFCKSQHPHKSINFRNEIRVLCTSIFGFCLDLTDTKRCPSSALPFSCRHLGSGAVLSLILQNPLNPRPFVQRWRSLSLSFSLSLKP